MRYPLLFAMLIATQCCDPKHDGYFTAQEAMKICVARGGVPISQPVTDQGAHTFQVLTHCDFPNQHLAVEK